MLKAIFIGSTAFTEATARISEATGSFTASVIDLTAMVTTLSLGHSVAIEDKVGELNTKFDNLSQKVLRESEGTFVSDPELSMCSGNAEKDNQVFCMSRV